MIVFMENDKTDGTITHVSRFGTHTGVSLCRFKDATGISIAFFDIDHDNPEQAKNEDGTCRLKNPVYLHLNTVSECQVLAKFIVQAAKDLGMEENKEEDNI